MKKIQTIVASLLLIASFIFLFVPKVNAEISFCSALYATVDPSNDFQTVVNIGTLSEANKELLEEISITTVSMRIILKNSKTFQDSKAYIENNEVIFKFNRIPPGDYPYSLKISTAVYDSRRCRDDQIVRIPDARQGGKFTKIKGEIAISPSNPQANDKITITVSDLLTDKGAPDNGSCYEAYIVNPPNYQTPKAYSANGSVTFTTDPISEGSLMIQVIEAEKEGNSCVLKNFNVVAQGEVVISGKKLASTTASKNPSSPCELWANLEGTPIPTNSITTLKDDEKKCISVKTAVGNINTDPAGFIKSIFSIVLGLAGGVALILIIISGYSFMTSQGNPEAIKNAQQQLIAAVVGLLFIIFSFVILQIIGVDILRIPGFNL